MFGFITGIVYFSAAGESYEKLINKIHEENIVCYDLKVIQGVLYGKTYRRNYELICRFADELSMDIKSYKKKGIIFKAVRYKKRYGFFVGGIAALAVITYLSNIVLKIEVSGNYSVSDERILAVLEANGVKAGSFIPDIDMGNTKRRIMLAFDELAWVGVRNTGGRLVVEVTEAVEKPEMIPANQKCNVVSSKKGQVVKIEVFSGQAAVKMGDGVDEGELLISGVITDKHGKSEIVHADGNVIICYEEDVSFSQPLQDTVRVEAGEKTKKYLSLWGSDFGIGGLSVPEGDVEHSKSTVFFSIFSIPLPIGITHENYVIYSSEEVVYTPFEAEKLVEERIADYEEIFLSDKKITDKKITKCNTKDGITYKVQYTLEGNACHKKNIIV